MCTSSNGHTRSTQLAVLACVAAVIVRSSGAPGLSNSPPMLAPSAIEAAMVVGESLATIRIGPSTVPTAIAVPVWLIIGKLTNVPVHTTPGTSKNRTYSSGFNSSKTRCLSQPVCRKT